MNWMNFQEASLCLPAANITRPSTGLGTMVRTPVVATGSGTDATLSAPSAFTLLAVEPRLWCMIAIEPPPNWATILVKSLITSAAGVSFLYRAATLLISSTLRGSLIVLLPLESKKLLIPEYEYISVSSWKIDPAPPRMVKPYWFFWVSVSLVTSVKKSFQVLGAFRPAWLNR